MGLILGRFTPVSVTAEEALVGGAACLIKLSVVVVWSTVAQVSEAARHTCIETKVK